MNLFGYTYFFIITLSCVSQEIIQNIPWHFPGGINHRFPIVANGIIKYEMDGGNKIIAKNETIKKYLEKIQLANFTNVIINNSPSNIEVVQGTYYNALLQNVTELNKKRDTQKLKMIIYDNRFKGGFPFFSLLDVKKIYYDSNVYGFFIDEPTENEFTSIERWVTGFNRIDTLTWEYNKILYVNLYGFYVYKDEYEKYLKKWITFKPRVLSFDNYSLWDDVLAKKYNADIDGDLTKDYFVNLEIYRQLSQKYKIPFWNWISVHRHWSIYSKRFYRRASISDIRFQVYSSLAYGARGILYYNFWNSPEERESQWHEEMGIIDYNGEETELYEEVKLVNANIKILGNILINIDCIGVYHASNSLWSETKRAFENNWDPLYDPKDDGVLGTYGVKLASLNEEIRKTTMVSIDKLIVGMKNPNGLAGLFSQLQKKDIYILLVNKNRFSNQTIDVEIDAARILYPQSTYLMNVITNEKIKGDYTSDHKRIQFKYHLKSGDGCLFRLIQTRKL